MPFSSLSCICDLESLGGLAAGAANAVVVIIFPDRGSFPVVLLAGRLAARARRCGTGG